MEEFYMGLWRKVTVHPPKKKPHIQMAKTIKTTTVATMESSAAIVG